MKYIDLEFEAEIEGQRVSLPPFLGATLRGALGYLLKQTVCQIAHGDCSRCVLCTVCPYPAVFEGLAPFGREMMRKYDRIPQPFVLLVPTLRRSAKTDTRLTWGVRLFGEACRYWPYLLHVYQVAGERGLGKQRLRYQLRQVLDRVANVPLWSSEASEMGQPILGCVPTEPSTPERSVLRWTFHTPVKLANMHSRLNGLDLVLAGRRRFQIMDYFYGTSAKERAQQSGERVEAGEFVTVDSRLHPWRLDRYSGRQQRRMSLEGLIGEVVIEGPWGRSGNWLRAAPILHLGKATSFGFGRVSWEVL